MILRRSLLMLLLLALAGGMARAEPLEYLNDPDYKAASTGEKLALLSVAKREKKISSREVDAVLMKIVSTELPAEKSDLDSLKTFGAWRKTALAKLELMNKARRKQGQMFVALVEVDKGWQRSLVVSVLAASLGADEAFKDLAVLKTIRESTHEDAHRDAIRAALIRRLQASGTYQKAHFEARLQVLKGWEQQGWISAKTRFGLEQIEITGWLLERFREKVKAKLLSERIGSLETSKTLSFFGAEWARSCLNGRV